MTISSTEDPRAGPYNGNGSQTAFPFSFKVFETSDLRVVHTDSDGIDTDLTLDSDFSVSLNADQNSNPGGTVTYPVSGDELPDGETLTITSDLDYTQETDIQNAGGFYPEVIENALDRITMLVKQVHTKVVRTLQLSVATPDDVDASLPVPVAASVVGWNAAGTALRNYLLSDGITVVGVNPDDLANDTDATKGSGMVGHKSDASGAVATTVRDRLNRLPLGLRADFGCAADDSTDDRDTIISAMSTAAAAGRLLVAEPGTYACSDWLPLPDKLKMFCSPGAVFKLTAETSLGGFLCGGYTADLVQTDFSDVDLHNLVIDCNNIAGENGFNAVNANGVRLYNPRVLNCVHSTVKLGGRAFQFEGGDINDLQIFSPVIEDCSIGINSHADSAAGTKKARAISYFDVTMRNVDVPFNIDAQFANPASGLLENMNTFVHGAALWNCGRISWTSGTALGGGIVCGDRGYGLRISGLRVINDAAYGQIGALVRGRVFNVQLSDVAVSASMVALYDFNPCGFGSPSTGSAGAFAIADNVRCAGAVEHVVKSSGGGVGAAQLQASLATAPSTALMDSNAGASTTAYGDFTLLSDGTRTCRQRFIDLYNGGNAFANFANATTGFRRVRHVKACNDEVNTGLLSIAAPAHSRISIRYTVSVMYPSSTTDAAIRVQTGVAVAALDGASNLTTTTTAASDVVAVDGVSSLTVVVDLVLVGGDVILRAKQSNEAADTACDVYIEADIVYSVGGTRTAPKVTLL